MWAAGLNGGVGLAGVHKSEMLLLLLHSAATTTEKAQQLLFFCRALVSVSARPTHSGYNYTLICETLDRRPHRTTQNGFR